MHRDDVEQALLTRFNVQLAPEAETGISDAWLEPRIAIFAEVCAPSVAGQEGVSRPWFVMIDARTPMPAVAAIRRACGDTDARIITLAGVYSDTLLREALSDHLVRDRPHLVTSRVDNDDALSVDYLDTVLEQARPVEQEVLVSTRGYQLAGSRLYAVTDPHSPFLTMVERTAHVPVTAFCAPHHLVHRSFTTRAVSGERMWLQGVHGGNIANMVTGTRVSNAELGDRLPHLKLEADVRDARFAYDFTRSWVRAGAHHLKRRVRATLSREHSAGS